MSELTRVEDIELPHRLVELKVLRRKDGGPVVVRCEYLNELECLEVFRGLPQAVDPTADEKSVMEQAAEFAVTAGKLIERATALEGDNGALTRPAFWFSEQIPGAIPGRYLGLEDRTLLVQAITDMFKGRSAEGAGFPADGGGGPAGGGAVDAGEGDGAHTGGSAAGSRAGV